MRKQESGSSQYGRLSSSCSSIRNSSHRTYQPTSTSLYKYSPANYTPGSRYSSSSSNDTNTIIASPLPNRSSRTQYPSSSMTRSTSTTSQKAFYTSPAAARASVSATENLSGAASSSTSSASFRSLTRYSTSNLYDNSRPTERASLRSRPVDRSSIFNTNSDVIIPKEPVDIGPTTRTHMVHPTSSHIRSRSTGIRTINVAQFNKQAQERAAREESDRQYREWKEKEKEREEEESFAKGVSSWPHQAQRIDDAKLLMATSYSSATGSSPPMYSPRNARSNLDDRSVSPKPGAPPPPPPPPPPGSPARIPRSVSAAVINSSSVKPTAKVHPYDDGYEKGCVVPSGFTGLRNIGNTCFMNAILQMLVNNIELREFFLNSHYKSELNESNPLGSQGRLACAFAEFMKQMWSGMNKAIEPVKIKEIVAEKASQFANFAQHDAHEFLSFLLDGLHEDVNRVKKKPLTGTVESANRHDVDVSNEAWHNHILRNDSIFVDLFHGQLKSHVQCPKCDRISITFDPFVYLPVPFPKRKKSHNIYFWPLDTQSKPIKITVSFSNEGTIADLLSAVGGIVRVSSRNLRAIEVFGHRIDKTFRDDNKVSDIGSSDVIYVFQIHDEADCNEDVVVLYVLQRQLFPNSLRYMCSECGTSEGKLKACDACYNAYYCSKDCQLNNWTAGRHRDECCRRPTSEVVGQPLIVSFPRSQLNYQQLYRTIEAKARHTVTIFQQPQTSSDSINSLNDENDSFAVPTNTFASIVKKRPSNGGVGAPPSFVQPPADAVAKAVPKRRSVLAEPRSKKSGQKVLDVRLLSSPTDSFGEALGESTPDDVWEKIKPESYILLSWINSRFGKDYITVGSRSELDLDSEKSQLLCSKSSNSIERSNNTETNPHLTQMLELFSETERLKPEESWYCSSCKEHVEATKRLQLFRLPPVLIIQLKRFVYTAFTHQSSMHRRSKDERSVEYPLENLDMKPFLADTAPIQNSTIYDLTGIVCHSGSSYFGHYISMGRLADFDSGKTKIEWRQFDDSMVTRQSVGNLQTDDAYLLFYKLRDSQVTRSIFKKHYSCDPGDEGDSEILTEKL